MSPPDPFGPLLAHNSSSTTALDLTSFLSLHTTGLRGISQAPARGSHSDSCLLSSRTIRSHRVADLLNACAHHLYATHDETHFGNNTVACVASAGANSQSHMECTARRALEVHKVAAFGCLSTNPN